MHFECNAVTLQMRESRTTQRLRDRLQIDVLRKVFAADLFAVIPACA
jgi:hypothetical protein